MPTPFEPGARGPAGFIPLSVPEIRGREWEYVRECLDTGWVSSVGSFVDRFEREFAARVTSPHAVATVNGTAALHVALRLAGVQPGDEVVVSTLTFIAPANAIRYLGAHPVFVDAEPDYLQLDTDRLAGFLAQGCERTTAGLRNRATGRLVRALLPVHILGHPAQLDHLLELARTYELPLIEDASESLGARWKGRPVGSFGDAGCFSFNGNKLITTGGGGMLTTANTHWANRARYLTTQAKDDPLEYIHHEVGYNYRLTNLQAAMGCAQLENLDPFLERKQRLAIRYNEAFRDWPGVTGMREAPDATSAWWLYTARFDPARCGRTWRELLHGLAAQGIQARPLWQPLHLSPAHVGAFCVGGEIAARLQSEALSLPCSIGLTDDQQDRVIKVLANLLSAKGANSESGS